jgi:hypothetical protein
MGDMQILSKIYEVNDMIKCKFIYGETTFELQKLDIITVDGKLFNPLHWVIQWRGLDSAVHNLTALDSNGNCLSPQIGGTKIEHISEYFNRNITIHRFKYLTSEIENTFNEIQKNNKGYDLKLWILGGIFGLTCKKWVNESKQYICSELPYWAIQENFKLTPKDETLPMPRFFRYNPFFEKIYEGNCGAHLFLD